MTDYTNIEYLKTGSRIQKRSYKILKDLQIMEDLREYNPLLTGTIPIGIDIEGSDLDIICEVKDFDDFEGSMKKRYGSAERYRVRRNQDNIVINFNFNGMEIEIYGEDKPAQEQNAYRHMLVESRLLELGGEEFRRKVVELKRGGVKTEPAFCIALGVEGDPYENMLDEELMLEAFKKRF